MRRNSSNAVASDTRRTASMEVSSNLGDTGRLSGQARQAGGHWFEPSTAHFLRLPGRRRRAPFHLFREELRGPVSASDVASWDYGAGSRPSRQRQTPSISSYQIAGSVLGAALRCEEYVPRARLHREAAAARPGGAAHLSRQGSAASGLRSGITLHATLMCGTSGAVP
jgi:hypothetical protein